MNNKAHFYLFLSLLYLLFVKFGCDGDDKPSGGTPSENNTKEEYRVAPGFSSVGVRSEYQNYYFSYNDRYRTIYLCGKADDYSGKYVWYNDGDNNGYPISISGNANNCYYDPSTGEFTQPIEIPTYNHSGPFSIAAYLGHDTDKTTLNTCNVFFDYGQDRLFSIRYSYQKNCNLFDSTNVGYEPYKRINNAFDGTHVVFTSDKTDLQNGIIHYDPIYDKFWVYIHDSINSSPPPNCSMVVMVENNDYFGDYTKGITAQYHYIDKITDEEDSCHCTFIFRERSFTSDITNLTNIDKPGQKEIVRTVIHEMGHLRTPSITDDSTEHNGVGKNHKCVIFNRTGITDEEFIKILENPIFCEGHKQNLLNHHD